MTNTKAYKIIKRELSNLKNVELVKNGNTINIKKKGKYVVKNYDLKFVSQIPTNIDSIISFVEGF